MFVIVLFKVMVAVVMFSIMVAIVMFVLVTLPPPQVEIFLDSLLMVFGEVEATHKKPGSKNPWQPVYKRYMVVLTTCVLQLYHPL